MSLLFFLLTLCRKTIDYKCVLKEPKIKHDLTESIYTTCTDVPVIKGHTSYIVEKDFSLLGRRYLFLGARMLLLLLLIEQLHVDLYGINVYRIYRDIIRDFTNTSTYPECRDIRCRDNECRLYYKRRHQQT